MEEGFCACLPWAETHHEEVEGTEEEYAHEVI